MEKIVFRNLTNVKYQQLKNAISKDKLRPQLMGVFLDVKNEKIVVTNGNVLVASHEWYSVGKPELNIRRIETLREDDRFAGVTPKKEPTKGVSGATKFHEKFRKSKRNGK